MSKAYKSELNTMSPVAIKLAQKDTHAPEHDTWGVVTCDACGDRFAVGPHRMYGSQTTEQQFVEQLETILASEHRAGRKHLPSYELNGQSLWRTKMKAKTPTPKRISWPSRTDA